MQNDDDDDFDPADFTPTAETYGTFNQAFAVINVALFEDELPDVLITMQRHKGSRGYFSPNKFTHRRGAEGVHEIALNPATFEDRTDREIASTLAHEMAHLWQEQFGKPSRNGYHNNQWANKMHGIGLMPSDTGKPGGKRTGQKVSHYIIEGGKFDVAWKLLEEAGFKFDYQDKPTNGPEVTRKQKTAYVCDGCGIKVWGKDELHIVCEDCGQRMEKEENPLPKSDGLFRTL